MAIADPVANYIADNLLVVTVEGFEVDALVPGFRDTREYVSKWSRETAAEGPKRSHTRCCRSLQFFRISLLTLLNCCKSLVGPPAESRGRQH